MKRYIFLSTVLLAAGTGAVEAQTQGGISTQLEVTRQYTPRVGQAAKLSVAPDMTDTVKLRPEISYSITSTASATSFATQPYEAVTVSTVPFERSRPLYIRAGVGAPFATALDLYYTPMVGTDRAFGIFANHRGVFSRLTNDIGVKASANEMTSGVGVWGERRWRRYGLEVEATYDNRTFDMYGYAAEFSEPNDPVFEWERVGWNRVGGRISFGDDFTDMACFNFRITLDGGFTHRAGGRRSFDWGLLPSEPLGDDGALPGSYQYSLMSNSLYSIEYITADGLSTNPNAFVKHKEPSQADVGLRVRVGEMVGDRHGFDAELAVRYGATIIEYRTPALYSYSGWNIDGNNLFGEVTFAPRYILELEKFSLRVGGDLFYINNRYFEQDRVRLRPAAEVRFNVVDDRLVPYATLSSRIMDGSMEALSRTNPYIYSDGATGLATDFAGGVMGDFDDRFSYKVTLGGSLLKDYNLFSPRYTNFGPVMFLPSAIDGTQYKAGLELGLHDVGGFSARLYGNWYSNKFDEFRDEYMGLSSRLLDYGTWLPDFDAGIALSYARGGKFSVSAGADMTGTRRYGLHSTSPWASVGDGNTLFSVSPVVDVFLGAEVRVAHDFWVWIEGRNLANQKLYPQPYYRGMGASVMAGVKMVF